MDDPQFDVSDKSSVSSPEDEKGFGKMGLRIRLACDMDKDFVERLGRFFSLNHDKGSRPPYSL